VVAGERRPREDGESSVLARDGRVRVVQWRNTLLYDDDGA
jgi:hypothetical protein